MIKINFIVHSLDKTNMGGVNKVITDLANILVDKEIDVSIYSLGKIENLCCKISSKVKIISFEKEKHSTTQYVGLNKAQWFLEIFKIFSKEFVKKKNEIWLPTSPPLNLIFSMLKYSFPNLKIIGCDHTSTVFSKGLLIDKIKYSLLKKLNYMVALTDEDKLFYESNGIKTVKIPNFIDLSIIKKLDNNRKSLIFVGRFSPEKQPLQVLEAYLKSKIWECGINLRMYGHGSLELELFDFLIKNQLQDNVEIISNEQNPEIIYKDALALLMTSKIEGFPMVLLEAISRNIPCIAYDCKYGPKNIIVDGVNGNLVEFGNLEQFVQKLEYKNLIGLIEFCKKDKKIEQYDAKIIVSVWLELLKKLDLE